QLEQQLNRLAQENLNMLESAKLSFLAAEQAMLQLKAFMKTYTFSNTADEIYFFKELKPKFYSKLVYYVKVFEIESQKPLGATRPLKKYLNKHLAAIRRHSQDHQMFYKYCRSGATYMDEVYFIRASHDIMIGFDLSYLDSTEHFCCNHDLTLATLIANEQLSDYLNHELTKLTSSQLKINANPFQEMELNWAETKASFVELMYGLQSLGAFYNSKTKTKADMSQVARFFETTLNIDLGNYYRTFQEIRIRKKGRTVFIDKLREQLIQRMDEADENPRYN
ncbi:MAG: RteC domain-containing protein, partial [Flavipsychrobacter sp.]